jgi:hypothetical protein
MTKTIVINGDRVDAASGNTLGQIAEVHSDSLPPPIIKWRCFHCGEEFTEMQERWAREHFGTDCSKTPVCLLRVEGEGGLIAALREAEDELDKRRCRDDDTRLLRALASMQSDRTSALRRSEEEGYARGLRDYAAYEAVAKQLADVLENAPQETGGHQISQSFVDDREKALADFDALENQ